MHRFTKSLMLVFLVFLFVPVCAQTTSTVRERKSSVDTADERANHAAEQIRLLQQRKFLLEQRLATLSRSSSEYALTFDWIRELGSKIEELKRQAKVYSTPGAIESVRVTSIQVAFRSVPSRSTTFIGQAQTQPDFQLSVPQDRATNEVAELLLAWTEDQQGQVTYTITHFIVEIATDNKRFSNGRFHRPIFIKEVPGTADSLTVPKDSLQSGQKYHWHVLAVYVPLGGGQSALKLAANASRSFQTEAQTFAGIESKGFTLQRAVAGNDATEGAEFGFLKTFNKNTVYTADFALIHTSKPKQTQMTSYAFQTSMQANLTSDESESEDALQFRAGAIIDRSLKRNTLNGLYISLAAKHESDQKFKIRKLTSENMVTPTLPALGIGIPFGRASAPVQFRWRPFFYFDVGHTFAKGDSAEEQDTILRLTPRVRTVLTLGFLRRFLNLNDTFVYADNSFYYLPREKKKQRHNMFTSGFALQFTKNFGFGLTYKNGEAAPKFKRVHTFGGVLSVRFAGDGGE